MTVTATPLSIEVDDLDSGGVLACVTECDQTLGGDGCPLVAAYAPEPFAAALGVSTMSGMQLLADALDLAHRLPATWRRVQLLEVPAWKARRLARATHHLTAEAAGYVMRTWPTGSDPAGRC